MSSQRAQGARKGWSSTNLWERLKDSLCMQGPLQQWSHCTRPHSLTNNQKNDQRFVYRGHVLPGVGLWRWLPVGRLLADPWRIISPPSGPRQRYDQNDNIPWMQPPTMWNGPRRRTNREEKSAELPGEPYGLRSITGILHTAQCSREPKVCTI